MPVAKAKWQDPKQMLTEAFDIVMRIKDIASEIKSVIVERDDLIDDMMVALVTGNHSCMIGDPGTAKSLLARELCKRIEGGKYFELLLNKYSDPAELLGPFSIKMMEQDRFTRVTTGKLPEAHVAFLDEVFKCNEPTLNALLAITNERVFHNDGKVVPIPLISLIGASNEEPEDESLKALYDRILFRFIVKPIADASNRLTMYNSFIDRRNPQKAASVNTTKVTVDELVDIRVACKYVQIPKQILNQYDSFLSEMKTKHQIVVSDRRKNEGLGIIQGSALMHGRDVANVDDFRHLIPVWWQRPEDIKVITDMILKATNPFESKVLEHKAQIDKILERINTASESTVHQIVIEGKANMNQITKDIDNMMKQAKAAGKDTTKIEELKRYILAKQRDMLKNHLGIDENISKSAGMDLGLDNLDLDGGQAF
jgi:MoxR-like ATPase